MLMDVKLEPAVLVVRVNAVRTQPEHIVVWHDVRPSAVSSVEDLLSMSEKLTSPSVGVVVEKL